MKFIGTNKALLDQFCQFFSFEMSLWISEAVNLSTSARLPFVGCANLPSWLTFRITESITWLEMEKFCSQH